MILLYLYPVYLLFWAFCKGFDVRLFLNEEESAEYNRERMKRRRIIKPWVNVKEMAPETYDYMIVHSLAYHVEEEPQPFTLLERIDHAIFWREKPVEKPKADFDTITNNLVEAALTMETIVHDKHLHNQNTSYMPRNRRINNLFRPECKRYIIPRCSGLLQ